MSINAEEVTGGSTIVEKAAAIATATGRDTVFVDATVALTTGRISKVAFRVVI